MYSLENFFDVLTFGITFASGTYTLSLLYQLLHNVKHKTSLVEQKKIVHYQRNLDKFSDELNYLYKVRNLRKYLNWTETF
jgi:hypothetical protein